MRKPSPTFGQRESGDASSKGDAANNTKRPAAKQVRRGRKDEGRVNIIRSDLAPSDLISVLKRIFGR